LGGVIVNDILADAGVQGPTDFVLAHCCAGDPKNVCFADLASGKTMVALSYEGQPLPRDHGSPAQFIVPHLYFWKPANGKKCANPPNATRQAYRSCADITFTATRGTNSGTPMPEGSARSASWQTCAIAEVIRQTPSIKSDFLRLSEPFAHIAGQHVDVRLTAPDGNAVMRSDSITSSPSASNVIELAIERLPDGGVSPLFHDIAAAGDEIELRRPLGGHFLWPERASRTVTVDRGGAPSHACACICLRIKPFRQYRGRWRINDKVECRGDQDRTIWRLTTPLCMTRATQWKDTL
jgi:hypothetical protein